MVDDQFRIAVNRQPSDAERYGDTETMEESLIFSGIVGRLEVDLEKVLESLTGQGDEHDTSPHAFNHEGAVEVHCPILKLLCDGRCLDFCPLGDEIDECLGLDGRPWLEGKLEGAELNRPLCNPSGGVAIVKDFTDREACDHHYVMRLEVVH